MYINEIDNWKILQKSNLNIVPYGLRCLSLYEYINNKDDSKIAKESRSCSRQYYQCSLITNNINKPQARTMRRMTIGQLEIRRVHEQVSYGHKVEKPRGDMNHFEPLSEISRQYGEYLSRAMSA